jgi:L-asparaginase
LQVILQSLIQEQFSFSPPTWMKRNRREPQSPIEQAVLRGAWELERHPGFNAGIGAVLQDDGRARLSASFMESHRRQFSAVINETQYPFASQLAYFLQPEKHRVRDGEGIMDLARELEISVQTLETPERYLRWIQQMHEASGPSRPSGTHGTIGCVGLASDGHLAAVTSTGGVGFEPRGRVGDTPTIAGNFVSERAAVSCTGRGEQIVDLGLAVRLASLVDTGCSLEKALNSLLKEALEREMSLAAIVVAKDQNGQAQWGWGTTANTLVWGRIEGDRGESC